MSNELQKISYSEINGIGKAFAESGMFPDVTRAAQAIVKISAGAELGVKPFFAMSGIHIIKGKATLSATLMASLVRGSNRYDYRVTEHSDTICSIDFYKIKKDGEEVLLGGSTFSKEDAERAGTQNMGKFPRNMLFARALSNGVKWHCPDIFNGPVYVEGELEQEPPKNQKELELIKVASLEQLSSYKKEWSKGVWTPELVQASLDRYKELVPEAPAVILKPEEPVASDGTILDI